MLKFLGSKASDRKLRLFAEAIHQMTGSDQHLAYEWMLHPNQWSNDPSTFVRAAREGGLVLAAQAVLLRDIFGNPFRLVTLDAEWKTPTVLSLAQAAYENRTLPAGTLEPDSLAILADALEDAGCDNADLQGHLRSLGPHVRGCWPVDLLLGKE
jgi:hypothetical protein